MIPSVDIPPHLHRVLYLDELGRTLRFARTRCWTWGDIQLRLRDLWKDPEADQVLSRLEELKLDEKQIAELSVEVDALRVDSISLSSKDRAKTDRRYLRLIKHLPTHLVSRDALENLRHPRKLRRIGAQKLLKNIGVDEDAARIIREVYLSKNDQQLLSLLARFPVALKSVDPEWLLREIEDPYWQMRVFESLLRSDDVRARRLRNAYPRQFLHAIGRMRATEYAHLGRELVRERLTDYQFLDLAAWTFGRLADQDGLDLVEQILGRELEREPIDCYFGRAQPVAPLFT